MAYFSLRQIISAVKSVRLGGLTRTKTPPRIPGKSSAASLPFKPCTSAACQRAGISGGAVMSKKMFMIYNRWIDGECRQFMVSGRNAQSLWFLVHSGKHGVTALEMSSWALRLGAYVHVLRHDYGLDIETKPEPHDGGYHARYVLHTPVEILEVYPTQE